LIGRVLVFGHGLYAPLPAEITRIEPHTSA
jgi:hypothetical protein